MKDLLQFIKAVFSHTIVLLSGGLIIVSLGLFERFSGANVPLWIYVCVLASIVCYACFLEWKSEHKKSLGAETRLEQKVDIIFENEVSYVEEIENKLANGIDKIIRVKVKNIGGENLALETRLKLTTESEIFPLTIKGREA
jgi:hypothetical protein